MGEVFSADKSPCLPLCNFNATLSAQRFREGIVSLKGNNSTNRQVREVVNTAIHNLRTHIGVVIQIS